MPIRPKTSVGGIIKTVIKDTRIPVTIEPMNPQTDKPL